MDDSLHSKDYAALSGPAEQDTTDWLSKTPIERLQALEAARQAAYGYDPATARMDKSVFEVVQLEDLE